MVPTKIDTWQMPWPFVMRRITSDLQVIILYIGCYRLNTCRNYMQTMLILLYEQGNGTDLLTQLNSHKTQR